MKKIVAISVLLVLLSAAVFAQDDGSGWKIGFTAQLARDFFYTTKATGEYTREVSNSPSQPLNDGTFTGNLGEHIKGSSNMWTYTGLPTGDQRLIVSLSNSGDHYKVYIDAKLDDSWLSGFSLMSLLSGDAADWEFSGDTGASGAPVIFDGKVGTGRYGGFVPAYEFWNDWLGASDFNFFGVTTMTPIDPSPDAPPPFQPKYQQSDNISTVDMDGSPWRPVYALGATFGGNFRFAIGSTFGWGKDINAGGVDNPVASASKIKGGFMLSGKNLGPLAFDLFYGINGGDDNTTIRGTGVWDNLLGVYLGLNVVENLGLSIGYTARFTKYETQQVDIADYSSSPPATKPDYVAFEVEAPVWSGVDIKINYNGIDKMGITFNNNLSFAGVAGVERKKDSDTVVFGLDGTPSLEIGGDPGAGGKMNTNTQNWFAWTAVLGVSYSLTDNLSVTLAIFDQLGIYTTEQDISYTGGSSNYKDTTTSNDLRTAIFAQYGVGNVTFGLGIQLFVKTDSFESVDTSKWDGGSSEETFKGSLNVVRFGIPIFFKVSI